MALVQAELFHEVLRSSRPPREKRSWIGKVPTVQNENRPAPQAGRVFARRWRSTRRAPSPVVVEGSAMKLAQGGGRPSRGLQRLAKAHPARTNIKHWGGPSLYQMMRMARKLALSKTP
jgi:hypothetical protein